MVALPNGQPVFARVGAPVRSNSTLNCRISPGIAPPLSFRCKQLIVVNLATAARGSHKVDAAFSIQIKQTREKLTGNFQIGTRTRDLWITVPSSAQMVEHWNAQFEEHWYDNPTMFESSQSVFPLLVRFELKKLHLLCVIPELL